MGGPVIIYRDLSPDDAVPDGVRVRPGEGVTVVAANSSGIVALLRAYQVIQLDPLWVREDYRGRDSKILPRLWGLMKGRLNLAGISEVEVGMLEGKPDPGTAAVIERLCKFVGGEEVKGRIFLLPT